MTASSSSYASIGSICIVFLHGIGDFVMLLPSLKKIRDINPGIKITVVLRQQLGLKRLAEATGLVDDVLEMPLLTHPHFYLPWVFWTSEYWTIKKRLRELTAGRKFDAVSIIYTQLLPTVFYKVFMPGRIKMHKVDRLAMEMGLSLSRQERRSGALIVPKEEEEAARQGLYSLTGIPPATKVIGIHRNTLDQGRRIELKEAQGFVDKLNAVIDKSETDDKSEKGGLFFLVFADAQSYRLEEQLDGGHLHAPNLRYSFEVSGREGEGGDSLALASQVAMCDAVVAVDSSVFNIAGALGKPTVGVFNTYKVHSTQRALEKDTIVCIDKADVRAEDLLSAFGKVFDLT